MSQQWKLTLEELVAGTEGKVVSQFAREYGGVGTDTRVDLKNKLFVALKGDSYDAHDFLPQAVEAGAAALLVHRIPENAKALIDKVTIIQVEDTLVGLQKLGNFWRHKMKAKIIGVTGTNGKTTTKEFSAAVIGSKKKVQYSKGSFNNHWGVPISLLTIDPSHEVAVIEMGMNHPGELKVLNQIAEPDSVMVTMVGRGHLEGVGSIEGVANAKAEIYETAPKDSIRIFNLENEHTRKMYERFSKTLSPAQIITFASIEYARASKLMTTNPHDPRVPGGADSVTAWPALDIAIEVTSATPESIHVRGEIRGVAGETTIPVFGRHNITNVMATAANALVCGLSPAEVWSSLHLARNAWGRNQWVNLQGGARVLFDGYNANPESMGAAVDNFASLNPPNGGRKIGIFGEMRELGSHAAAMHHELGERAGRAGFDLVWFLGPSRESFDQGLKAAGFKKSSVFSDSYKQNLALETLPMLDRNDIVLIKGSRGMQLEKVLQEMKPLDFEAKK